MTQIQHILCLVSGGTLNSARSLTRYCTHVIEYTLYFSRLLCIVNEIQADVIVSHFLVVAVQYYCIV